MTSDNFSDNTDRKRFELFAEGHTAFMEYIRTPNHIYLTHTEVPPAIAGRGIGQKLAARVLDVIQEQGLSLIPLCPFVASYLRKHPEKQALIAEGYGV